MNLLEFKNKLEKGKSLDAKVVYIKEDSIIFGIKSVFRNQENKDITLLKSKDETIKVDALIKILDELYSSVGDGEVLVCNDNFSRDLSRKIQSLEFAQYELIKMIFINI